MADRHDDASVRAAAAFIDAQPGPARAPAPATDSTAPPMDGAPPPSDETPLNVARAILAGPLKHTLRWQSQFYTWRAGAYRVVEAEAIRRVVWYALEHWRLKAAPRGVSDVVDALAAVALIDAQIEPPCWRDGTPAEETVVFPNGRLNLRTGRFEPPSPELIALTTAGVEYDEAAPEPLAWLDFLETVWGDDPESIDTLQEIAGYLLTARTDQQKVFLLVGPMRSGKGTIFRTLVAMLGRESVAAPTLSSLGGPFGLQALIGKSAAMISDARLGRRPDADAITERLLSISGEDHVNASRKFLPDYTARLRVRFVLASNELPRLADSSGALASRFVVLQMRRSFLGEEDVGLSDRLRDDLPGVLLWALEGLRRLNARGRFVQPASAADAVRTMEDIGSPIRAFLRDECTLDPGATIPVDDLYRRWVEHCEAAGHTHRSPKEVFCRDLYAAAPAVSPFRGRVGNVRIHMLRGVRAGHQVRGGQGDPALHTRTRTWLDDG